MEVFMSLSPDHDYSSPAGQRHLQDKDICAVPHLVPLLRKAQSRAEKDLYFNQLNECCFDVPEILHDATSRYTLIVPGGGPSSDTLIYAECNISNTEWILMHGVWITVELEKNTIIEIEKGSAVIDAEMGFISYKRQNRPIWDIFIVGRNGVNSQLIGTTGGIGGTSDIPLESIPYNAKLNDGNLFKIHIPEVVNDFRLVKIWGHWITGNDNQQRNFKQFPSDCPQLSLYLLGQNSKELTIYGTRDIILTGGTGGTGGTGSTGALGEPGLGGLGGLGGYPIEDISKQTCITGGTGGTGNTGRTGG